MEEVNQAIIMARTMIPTMAVEAMTATVAVVLILTVLTVVVATIMEVAVETAATLAMVVVIVIETDKDIPVEVVVIGEGMAEVIDQATIEMVEIEMEGTGKC